MEEFCREKVPPVLAVVLYNGEREWVEALDTRERIALEPGSDVEGMLPRMRLPVIDEWRARQLPAELRNVAGLMFQLWDLSTLEDLAELVGRLRLWLGSAGQRSLREAFETVLVEEVVPAYFEEGSVMRGVRELRRCCVGAWCHLRCSTSVAVGRRAWRRAASRPGAFTVVWRACASGKRCRSAWRHCWSQ